VTLKLPINLPHVYRINTELDNKLIAEIKKINSHDAVFKAPKIFNNMITKTNSIEKACCSDFASVNASIETI
jgi:hypothetical protein